MLSHLDSDPMEDSLFLVTLGPRLPSFVRKLACWIAKTFLGDSLFPRFFSLAREKSVLEFTDFTDQRIRSATYLSVLAAATITYNVINSPGGTIPVTRINSDTDNLSTDFVVGASGRSKMFETRMYLGKNPVYDPKAMEGIPIGVQLVGKKWEDEKVLAMMHVVDAALGLRGFGPGSWEPIKTVSI
ncbi:hypothetical protein BDR07DRAFT_1429889 [Suillus spraguei]|nr:hypothetical protein BDR07DRAFT_1429889 [Suillus spraguei]